MRRKAPTREIPPPLELECLRILWQLGEGTVHDVREALAERRDLAYTTVMTLMDRLSRKGAVARVKSGRSFLYTPAVDRETLRQAALRDLIDNYFEGDERALHDWLSGEVASPAVPSASSAAASRERRLDTALL
jgi:predicted transcriptional regulator